MSKARKCDICGKLYEYYTEDLSSVFKKECSKSKVNAMMFVDLDDNDKYYPNTIMDCCPTCLGAIKQFIKECKEEGDIG